MKYGLFLGCTIPSRGRAYELSARKVLDVLGVEYIDIQDFACCGFPIKPASVDASLLCALRNLAVAEQNGISDLIVLCSGCTVQMTEAHHEFMHNEKFKLLGDEVLGKLGRKYNGAVKIKHFLRFLWEDIGTDKIKMSVKRPLEGLKVAPHYGCHYMKPTSVYGFDFVEDPRSLDDLVSATGATVVHYRNYIHCCGGTIMGINAKSTYAIARNKLDYVKASSADCITLACPFCGTVYDDNQKAIEEAFAVEYKIPVLFYSQLLGLALGIPQKDLGFALNKVKPKDMLQRVGITE
jgi:heterodisulfide reductase subunit B